MPDPFGGRCALIPGTPSRHLPLAAISVLHSCENYCELHLVSGEMLLVRHTLKAVHCTQVTPTIG